jgi:hypothetical protein
MKAFDPDTFVQLATEDFTWRVKELSDLKQIIRLSGGSYAYVARKAALALVYAHWEGYVVFVVSAYLAYISKRKRTFSKLMPSLHALALVGHVQEWQKQRDSIGLRLKMIEVFRSMEKSQFKRVPVGAVTTGGNLNFERFADICKVLMIDPASIVSDQEYLDNEIVGIRNRVAHGDYIVISDERLEKATDFILAAMRSLRTDVENCVVQRSFMLQLSTST